MPQEATAKRWCGTVKSDDVTGGHDELIQKLQQLSDVWIFQKERASTGYVHYQVYVELRTRSRFSKLKEICNSAHWEKVRGTRKDNWNYCSKEDSRVDGPWQSGPMPEGEKTISRRKECVDFLLCHECWDDIVKEFPDVLAQSYGNIRNLWRDVNQKQILAEDPFGDDVLAPWMVQLLQGVEAPDHRTVNWVIDLEGGKGKTRFAKYLDFKFTNRVFITRGGKLTDVAYEYQMQPIVIFDLAREKQEYFQYAVLEQLKDGIMTSAKYESTTKKFKSPWVLVLANWGPDFTKLSADRWNVINV